MKKPWRSWSPPSTLIVLFAGKILGESLFQLFRFGVAGLLATATHFFSVILLVQLLHQLPWVANIYGACFGLIVSFLGHRYWTFSQSTQTLRAAFPRFLLTAIINFLGNQVLYYCLLQYLKMPYRLALLIVLMIMACLSFLLNKCWVFRSVYEKKSHTVCR